MNQDAVRRLTLALEQGDRRQLLGVTVDIEDLRALLAERDPIPVYTAISGATFVPSGRLLMSNGDIVRRLSVGFEAPEGGAYVQRPPQLSAQHEAPYPGADTVVFSLRLPDLTAHVAKERCSREDPHPIAECGEFAEDSTAGDPAGILNGTPDTKPTDAETLDDRTAMPDLPDVDQVRGRVAALAGE